ncbi:MAG: DoxX family protein [Pseudomonadota bacterium]
MLNDLISKTSLPRFAANHLLFLLTLGVTFVFLMAGSMKVRTDGMMVMGFTGFGYPVSFMIFIGYAEVFGAISLWLRRWAFLGALGLTVIVIGAAATHLLNDDPIEMSALAYAMVPAMLLITAYHWRASRAGR